MVKKYPLFWDWFYNAATKKIETSDGAEVGPYTYERPFSTNLGLGFKWVALNPLNYPTKETAKKVYEWVKSIEPSRKFALVEMFPESPGAVVLDIEKLDSFPMYMIQLQDDKGNKIEDFSAGLLGFSRMKNGDVWASRSFLAEIQTATQGVK